MTVDNVTLRFTLVEKDGDHPQDMAVGESREICLDASRPAMIGRLSTTDFPVFAPSVGRMAVKLTLDSTGVWVDDLGSGGGSLLEIDGVVTPRPSRQLPKESILRIGRVAFHVTTRPARIQVPEEGFRRAIGPYGVLWQSAAPVTGSVVACRVNLDQAAEGSLVSLTPARRGDMSEAALLRLALAIPSHPNVARILDIAPAGNDEWPWFVHDYMQGISLAWLITPRGESQTPLVEALRILDEICAGAAALHREGIVHRNLSTRAVFVAELSGMTKIIGCEFARVPGAANNQPGELVGLSAPMPPETMLGLPIDERADIFQIGVIAYELVTGTRPFEGDAASSLANMIKGVYPPLTAVRSQLDPDLVELIDRALEREADRRWHCVDSMRTALAPIRRRIETTTHADGTLFDAAWVGDETAIHRLLAAGASPVESINGLTPLHLAAANGWTSIVEVLLDAGALVDEKAFVIEAMRPQSWLHLIARPPRRRSYVGDFVDAMDGCRPLHLACDAGHREVVEYLLARGADPHLPLEIQYLGPPERVRSAAAHARMERGEYGPVVRWTPAQLARGGAGELSHEDVLTALARHGATIGDSAG